jgi:hypothetical protein
MEDDRATVDVDAAAIGVREVAAAGARDGPGQAGRSRLAGGAALAGDPRQGLDPMPTIAEAAPAAPPA